MNPLLATLSQTRALAGQEKALAHAKGDWLSKARLVIDLLARSGERFTSEDVLRALDPWEIATHDRRALGGLFRKAASEGLIETVGFDNAKRPQRHAGAVRVWRGKRA